ncbi:NUDIX domain-containing protein [Microbacterium pseudoresistens]
MLGGTAVTLRDGTGGVEVLLVRRPDRGSFAGAWVFPGGVAEESDRTPETSEIEIARRTAIRETEEEVGLRIRDLVPLSCWSPPPEAPKRVRTWFFLTADAEGDLHSAAAEVVDAVWLTPGEALARHAEGALSLFPPTWVTLHGLTGRGTAAEALAAAGEPARFRTRLRHAEKGLTSAGQVFLWEGDEEHPDSPGAVGARHRLETGAGPWRYVRD